MSDFQTHLQAYISAKSRSDSVALLLSGGIDSLSVGFALRDAGKTFTAYTYEIQGYPSRDRPKAELLARHLGCPLRVITVPNADASNAFIRLAVQNGCRKKVHHETSFPWLYALPEIEEAEIWSGWNADDHYGNTRKIVLDQARMVREGSSQADRKAHFDEWRRARFAQFDAAVSSDTWWHVQRLADRCGKRLLDPYTSTAVRDFFFQFDHEQLSSPKKPLIRQALAAQLQGLPTSSIAVGVKLQIGGSVDALYRTLLNDDSINRFVPRYASVSLLCQRWAKEVQANPGGFGSELANFPPLLKATTRLAKPSECHPYTMDDVRMACAASSFTVVSTFSGGGGSSIGYRLAGGNVLAASEFVPEAARTYRTNFPDCLVDQRDIRDITQSQATVEAFLSNAGLKPRDLDVLDGSPPCCEFSVAGNGISDQNVLRQYSDVKQRNIATLAFDFVDLASKALPKIVICENVPAFATRGGEIFKRVIHALRFPDGEGTTQTYYVNWSVLAASDFGVPQKRRRLFILGIRSDVGDAVGITSDEQVLRIFPTPTHTETGIRSAFAGLNQSANDRLPWVKSAMTSSLGSAIRRLPKNPPKLTRIQHISPGDLTKFTLTRCSWDLPAPTLVVSGQRPDGMTGVVHPEEDRKFTLPELKRLFSLPDDYALTGTLAQGSEPICRMVPPLLTKAIAKSLYDQVLRPHQEGKNANS